MTKNLHLRRCVPLLLFAILTTIIFSCRADENITPQQTEFSAPIISFKKFDDEINSNLEFKTQNKQYPSISSNEFSKSEFSTNAQYSSTTVNIPISDISYKIPFKETIENYFAIHPDYRQGFFNAFGEPFYNLSTYTYGRSGNNAKSITFPIIKNDIVTAIIQGVVSPSRDYVQFTVVKNNDLTTQVVIAKFQYEFDNLYPSDPEILGKNNTAKGAFTKEKYIRESNIEEVVIYKINQIDNGGSGGFGLLVPGKDWWKDANWYDPKLLSQAGGQAMSGGAKTHNELPDYLDPNDDPCNKVKNNNSDAKNLINKTDVKNKKEDILKDIKTDTNEKSFSFGKDKDGNYKTTDIKTGTSGNTVGVTATSSTLTIEAGAHTHTTSLFDCFSAGDFYAFHGANTANSNFKNYYVFAEDAAYVMTITNPTKFKDFTKNFPQSEYFDTVTGDWKEGTTLFTSFDNAYKQFLNSGLNEDLAFEYATAMMMTKYDMGMALSKQDSVGDFNTVFVKENKIPIQVAPGVFINISTYEKSDDCNLK